MEEYQSDAITFTKLKFRGKDQGLKHEEHESRINKLWGACKAMTLTTAYESLVNKRES